MFSKQNPNGRLNIRQHFMYMRNKLLLVNMVFALLSKGHNKHNMWIKISFLEVETHHYVFRRETWSLRTEPAIERKWLYQDLPWEVRKCLNRRKRMTLRVSSAIRDGPDWNMDLGY